MPYNNQVRAQASQFQGLNNVRDPRRLKLSWLTTATNVDIDDDGYIVRRHGRTRVHSGTYRNAYAPYDGTYIYLASDTKLYMMGSNEGLEELSVSLDPSAPVRFAEVNREVYILNGANHWVGRGSAIREWGQPVPSQPVVTARPGNAPAGEYQFAVSYIAPDGRESGLSTRVQAQASDSVQWRIEVPQHSGYRTAVYMTPADDSVLYRIATTDGLLVDTEALGIDMSVPAKTEFRYPPPPGSLLEFMRGRMLVGDYYPEYHMSVIWQSDPLGFEHFQMDHAYIPVPGEIRAMVSGVSGLLIGTDTQVMLLSPDLQLTTQLDYGVPSGAAANIDDRGFAFMWTFRGLVVEGGDEGVQNLMDEAYSPPASHEASVALLHQGGFRKVVALARESGQPYNAWRKY